MEAPGPEDGHLGGAPDHCITVGYWCALSWSMGGAWAAQAKERPPSAQSTKRRQKWSNNPYVHELAYAIPKGIATAPPPLLLCFAANDLELLE